MQSKRLKAKVTRPSPRRNSRIELNPYAPPMCDGASIWIMRESVIFPPHALPTYEVDYVHKGTMTFNPAGDRSMCMRGGDVSIIQPGVMHACENNLQARCTYFVMGIHAALPVPCPPFENEDIPALSLLLQDCGNRVVRACDGTDVAFGELLDACGYPPEVQAASWYKAWMKNLVDRMVLHIIRSLAARAPAHAPQYLAVETARGLLEKNISQPLKIAAIARAVGLKPAQFARLFRMATGQSPAEYRMRLRVEAAAEELRRSSKSISRIASQFSFFDNRHFAVTFRKYMHTTPTAWRQRSVRRKTDG